MMLKDAPRTEAYRKAILGNKAFFNGKTVMDVGAGTGILSLFCAQAGAKKVYAVEASHLAHVTRKVVEKNQFSHVIEVIQGKAEDVDLPEGVQVDVIVSEWMGFYLLHESMLDSVIAARDKHLKADGVMLPSKATLYAAACRLPDLRAQQVDFWSDVYGFDMSPFADLSVQSLSCKPEICTIQADDLLSKPVQVAQWDLAWVAVDEIQSVKSRHFVGIETLEPTDYQGVALWFDCAFDLGSHCADATADGAVVLSTCPRSPPTHWKQTVIVLPTSLAVEEGDVVGWQLELNQSVENHRHYVMTLNLLDADADEHPVPCDCGQVKCVIIASYLAQEDQELKASGIDVIDIS